MRLEARPPSSRFVAVMRSAGETIHGQRLRRLIVVLWRVGLRIRQALALAEPDLDSGRSRTRRLTETCLLGAADRFEIQIGLRLHNVGTPRALVGV